jgi:hypothetical protein
MFPESGKGEILKERILMYKMAHIAFAVVLVLCLNGALYSQSTNASLTGYVSDPSKAVIPDAKVTAINVGTNIRYEAMTNASGGYTIANLPPGTYRIQVEKPGFKTVVKSDVDLHVQDTLAINFEIGVGATSEVVTVESGTPLMQLESSSVGNVVDSHTVVDLPLNGRDWTLLVTLEPGVAQVRTQKPLAISNDRPNRGLGSEVTIGGNRPQQNNYRLDGVSINDYASGAPGSIQGAVLGVDAVQEFSVVTSNAPADYGKTSGGVINAASRSGTNSFHGTGYEFLRNNVFDARNFFDTVNGKAIRPPFKRNQFGGSAGGHIVKDRTFFFADYEGLRQSQGNTNVDNVPSVAARSGQLAAGNVTVDPLVVPYLNLFPLPNGIVNGDTGQFSFVAQQVTNEDFVTGRIDHKLSESDSLFGTYVFDRGETTSPDTYNFKNIGTKSRRHTFALEESHTFSPALVNVARFGFNRTVSIAPTTLSAINPAAASTSLGFVPGLPVGLINVTGLTNFQGGLRAVGEFDFHYNSYQVYDDLYWTRSKHSLKLGFYAEHIQSNQLGTANPNGQYIFGGLAAFLTNHPTSFNAPISSAISPRDLRQDIYGGYIQDDYKFRPNLTFNLGLRYEMATVPTESSNRLSTLVNLNTDTTPRLGSPYFSNPTLKNFAPRVGFAWDPFGTGKTSVRGAFGIYDVLPLPYQFELISLLSAPFSLAGNVTPAPVGSFPTGAFNQLTVTTLRNGYVQQNPHRNYVEQWSFNVQRELARNFTVTLGYIGSHGVHQPFHVDDINVVQPTLTPAGFAWPASTIGTTRLNPNVRQISAVTWNTSSVYHGLNVEAIKRLSHGFQIQTSYTFSKSIDTSSSGIAGDTFGNSVSSLPAFDAKVRRGLSDFDVRHVLMINGLWMIPSPKSWSGVPKWLASGWQPGGILTLTSGLPFTTTIGGDPLGLKSADPYAFPDRIAGCSPVNGSFKTTPNGPHYLNTACFSFPVTDLPSNTTLPRLLGNAGRNTVIGPGLEEFDFSLFKNNPIRNISETFNVQFRWEVFNVANRANFNPPTNPNRQIFTAAGALNGNAGLLNSTSTSSRQMQFAVKFIW